MSVTRKHGLYAAKLHTDAMESAVIIGGHLRAAIQTGTDVRAESTDGIQYPVHQAIYAQEPMASMQTHSIAALLDEIGTQGLLVAGSTNPGVQIFAYKRSHGGARASGSNHRIYSIADGLAIPEQISVDHRNDATLDWQVLATYDGTNEPLTVTDSSAVPTIANNNERFTIGPLTLGAISLDEIKSAQIDFGIRATREAADSDIWPTHVSIDDIAAVLTFSGIDVEWLKAANIPFGGGKVTTHANGSFYLKKRDRSTAGQFATGSDHIKFTFDGLAVISEAYSASGQDGATCSIQVVVVWDGTNAPIVATTGSALP